MRLMIAATGPVRALLLAAMLFLPHIGHAQVIGAVKGVKFAPEYYPPPNQAQVRTLLEAAKMQPLGSNRFLLTEARLQSFKPTGEAELIVRTPECTYDSGLKQADSAGELHVQTGDGKFSLQGQGFLWQQTNSSLFVSNRVFTTVQSDVIARDQVARAEGATSENGPVDISADSFQYNSDLGDGNYRGNVRVTGTNVNGTTLGLSSGLLNLKLPMKTRELQQVTAEQSVVLDYSGVHATGERVVYDVNRALARVTGHPGWQSEGREGRGDEFVIDRNAHVLRADGNAWLKLPAQSMGSILGNSSDTKAAGQATPGIVEIECARYEMRTNSATFDNNVRVVQKAGADTQGQMTCQTMNVTFTGTNQLDTLIAEQQVVIKDAEREFTATKAVYSATNNLLDLTGDPRWRAGDRDGKANLLRFDLQRDEMLASGNASMRLPAEQLGTPAGAVSGTTTAAIPSHSGPPDFAEIFSESYTVGRDRARFQGGVYISHPRMVWSCQTVDVALPAKGQVGHKITAQQSVFFELVDRNGQKIHGRGEKAIYLYSVENQKTNDFMELTGDPVIETTNGTFRNKVIIFDRAQNKLIAPGKYVIRGSGGVLAKEFKMPTNRWLK